LKTKIFSGISIVVLVVLDQILKIYIQNSFRTGTHKFIHFGNTEILNITYCENTGAAFSIFEGKQAFLIIMTSLLMVVCIWFLFKNKEILITICLTLIIAGGFGNLIDRIFRGYVIDFFEIRLFHFGIFNFADCLVVIGAAVFAFYVFIYESKAKALKNETDGEL
jgi:signal peptidase II